MRRFIRAVAIAGIAATWPAMAVASDQDMAQQIANNLRSSGQFVDYSIGVKYENGTAWILGRVANDEQRDRAVAMARQMAGVSNVVCNLEVRSTNPSPTQGLTTQFVVQDVGTAGGVSQGDFPEASLSFAPSGIAQTAAQAPASSDAKPTSRARNASKTRAVPAAASRTVNDPGDPLAQTAAPNFAPAPATRRYANTPISSTTRQPQAGGRNTQAAYMAGGQGDNSMAGAPVGNGQVVPGSMRVQDYQLGPNAAGRNPNMMANQQMAAQQMQMAAQQRRGGVPAQMAGYPQQQGMQAMPAGMMMQTGMSSCPPGGCPPGGAPLTAGQPMPSAYHYPRGVGTVQPAGMQLAGCQGGACAGPANEQPNMPCHAWPSYASYPNYGAVTYPKQYSATAWPYIGPFYPYPQVPLGWRKVTLEWDDGWWWLDFYDTHTHH